MAYLARGIVRSLAGGGGGNVGCNASLERRGACLDILSLRRGRSVGDGLAGCPDGNCNQGVLSHSGSHRKL